MIRTLFVLAAFFVGAAHAEPRLQVIGALGPQPVSEVQQRVEGSIVAVAKAIAPKGWTGFTSRSVDVTRTSSITVVAGEAWTTAFERWLEAEALKATIDATGRRIFIDQGSPKAVVQPAVESSAEGARIAASPTVEERPAVPAQTWEVKVSDLRLETTLERWVQQAGYRLLWDADRHILITAEDRFSGSFNDALNRVLNSPAIRESDYPLEAVVYANDPPLLRITRLGDQPNKE
ncbi:MAG: TcpQ domain-containing protein [Hydrogenophaga sp.]|nr:TcpQ domain-containing protein [Hydrogenophaga sp.]